MNAIRQYAKIVSLVLISLIGQNQALAFRTPIGAVAAQKKLGAAGGEADQSDLTFSPILLDMAKIVGRTGLPPGFFLTGESPFPEQPGIDLRTLLLYQAGLLKMPIRLITQKRPSDNDPPRLSAPGISQPRPPLSISGASDNLPLLAHGHLLPEPEGTQVVTARRQVGSPERISLPGGDLLTLGAAPMISFDYNGFQSGLTETAPPSEDMLAALPRLNTSIPKVSAMPFITRSLFRLWTVRQGQPDSTLTTTHDTSGSPYEGTFVVAMPGVIKAISGRQFYLAPGRLLACNQAGFLTFKTDYMQVSVEPDCAAIIEVLANGICKVSAIETRNGNAVVIIYKGSNKPIRLNAGDEAVAAERELSAGDLTALHMTDKNKLTMNTAKKNFSIKEYLERDLLLKSDLQTRNREHKSALIELRKRLRNL